MKILRIILIPFLLIFCSEHSRKNEPTEKVLAQYDSIYNKEVIVRDTKNQRNLIFFSSSSEYSQGTMDLQNPHRLVGEFMECMMLGLFHFDTSKQEKLKVLNIGLWACYILEYELQKGSGYYLAK